MEIWKEIPGSGGKYQISNYGNVYSLINNVQLKGVIMEMVICVLN